MDGKKWNKDAFRTKFLFNSPVLIDSMGGYEVARQHIVLFRQSGHCGLTFSTSSVTCVFFALSLVTLTGTLECTCSFRTRRTEDLETIWQPVSVEAVCPLVHPPLPVNRVTPIYLFMISFLPPPSPPSVGNIVLFWDVKAAAGLSLQDHGSLDLSPFNQRTMLIHSSSWVWFIVNIVNKFFSCHIFVLIPSFKDQV